MSAVSIVHNAQIYHCNNNNIKRTSRDSLISSEGRHLAGLESNDGGGGWAVLKNNFVPVSHAGHSLIQQLPEKPANTRTPFTGTFVDCIVHLPVVAIPLADSVALGPWWPPEFCYDHRFLEDRARVLNVVVHPVVHERGLGLLARVH